MPAQKKEVTLRITHLKDLPEGWIEKIEDHFYGWAFAQGCEVGVRVVSITDVRGEDPFAMSLEAVGK